MLLAAIVLSGTIASTTTSAHGSFPPNSRGAIFGTSISTERSLPSAAPSTRLATMGSPRLQYCRAWLNLGNSLDKQYTVIYATTSKYGCAQSAVPFGLAGFPYVVAPVSGSPGGF
jgi:hypothetical protein